VISFAAEESVAPRGGLSESPRPAFTDVLIGLGLEYPKDVDLDPYAIPVQLDLRLYVDDFEGQEQEKAAPVC
jgi:hypothetical protein